MNSSERLKLIRGTNTQAEFAAILGIHKNSLGRYERGDSEPDLEIARAICTKYGVSPEWFLFGTGEMHRSGNSGTDNPPINKQIDVMYCENCKELQGKIIELQNKIIELQDDYMQLLKNSMAKK